MPSAITQPVVGAPVYGAPVMGAAVVSNDAKYPSSLPSPATLDEKVKATLNEMAWPRGLASVFATSLHEFPVRYVVVDNSGSMQATDGSRLVATAGGLRTITCTRWAELGDAVSDMAELVSLLGSETSFHLLNPTSEGQFFKICERGRAGAPDDLEKLRRAMSTSPRSSTPLTEAVSRLIELIAPSAAAMRANGQRAVVVIATDGLPNDTRSFTSKLLELQRLPVWLVVRLCTNEPSVVDFWSDLDKQLEAPMEVIDDLAGEAAEVAKYNPWLAYGPPLQLARTLGMHDRNFDLLDEGPMPPAQIKPFLERLLDASLPEPELEPEQFIEGVREALTSEPLVYNPRKRNTTPWVDMALLERSVKGRGSGCVIA